MFVWAGVNRIKDSDKKIRSSIEKKCETIEICEMDVYNKMQAPFFDYYNGINSKYKKELDPYYNKNTKKREKNYKENRDWSVNPL